MANFVGPFFCILDKVYAHRVPIEAAEAYGECLTTSVSHLDLWDEQLAARFPRFEYADFPRGRVVHKNGRYIIYADQCLLDYTPFYEVVTKTFGIMDKRWTLKPDEHYQCACCSHDTTGALVSGSYSGGPGKMPCENPDALSLLDADQYPAFAAAMQHILNGMGYAAAKIWVTPDGVLQVGHNFGVPLSVYPAASEAMAVSIAHKVALSHVLNKPLIIYRPAQGMERFKGDKLKSFLESLSDEKIYLAEPINDYF